ncbi:MAG: glucosaminidase domain-containing protein [Spongiibacteraceae bacterium]
MIKFSCNMVRSLTVLMVLILFGLAGCSESDEQSTNMPQAEDMAVEGEQGYDAQAAAAARDNAEQMFVDYADNNLRKLKLIARDGTVKREGNFEVDYKKLPNFKDITHIPDRKSAFFDYLRPAIEYQNQLISERRQILKGIEIRINHHLELSSAQEQYMQAMRKRYRVPEEDSSAQAVALLLRRVDTLPVSMVLAQAAVESAWGTSRFAREGNNLFGQWCFSKGCGLVPEQRSEGSVHEVQKFSSVDKAIGAYFLNINSHPAYVRTREVRERIRAEGKTPTGVELVQGLEKYSVRGEHYVKELRNMILSNGLEAEIIKST